MLRLKRTIRLWLLIAVVVFFSYFSYNNQAWVDVYLPPFIARINVPGYFAYLAFFIAGAVMVSFYFALAGYTKNREIRRLRKQLTELGVHSEPTGDGFSSKHAGASQVHTHSSAGDPLP